MKPLIGIPTEKQTIRNELLFGTPSRYSHAIELAGGAPILIPLTLGDESLRTIFSRLDGLFLTGGGDADPREFGEAVEPFCGEIDPARDAAELTLTRWALDQAMPVLGICRGVQMLNVAAGGSLYQDIGVQVQGALDHRRQPGDSHDRRTHAIEVDADSALARALGESRIEVNSSHHQAVKQVAAGFRVVARAPDGIIEALEAEDGRFALGVQFHPEWLVDDERILCIFREFVRRAAVQRG